MPFNSSAQSPQAPVPRRRFLAATALAAAGANLLAADQPTTASPATPKLSPIAEAQLQAILKKHEKRLSPQQIEVILAQSRRIVKMDRGILVTETRHGFVCANAGVDQSNTVGDDFATVLPDDPDASARRLREALGCGAVIVTDTFGRPWREGLVDVAIGVAGLEPLEDYRGSTDRRGRPLNVTIIAVADQLAAAAGLLMRKPDGAPVVLIRGFNWRAGDGSARVLLRRPEMDLFR